MSPSPSTISINLGTHLRDRICTYTSRSLSSLCRTGQGSMKTGVNVLRYVMWDICDDDVHSVTQSHPPSHILPVLSNSPTLFTLYRIRNRKKYVQQQQQHGNLIYLPIPLTSILPSVTRLGNRIALFSSFSFPLSLHPPQTIPSPSPSHLVHPYQT